MQGCVLRRGCLWIRGLQVCEDLYGVLTSPAWHTRSSRTEAFYKGSSLRFDQGQRVRSHVRAPEVDQHQVQWSAEAQLFAGQSLALKQHEQRHPPESTALVLHVPDMQSAEASLLRRCCWIIAGMYSKPGGRAAADMFAYHPAAQGWGEPLALVRALHLAPHAQLQAVRLVEAAGHLLHAARECFIFRLSCRQRAWQCCAVWQRSSPLCTRLPRS